MSAEPSRASGNGSSTLHSAPTRFAPTPAARAVDSPLVTLRPEPPWLVGRAVYDHGNISEIDPPPLERDALAVLTEARGEARLRQDLAGGLRWCDQLIREAVRAILTAADRQPIVDQIIRLLADRGCYSDRLQAVGGDAPAALAVPIALVRWVAHPMPTTAIDQAVSEARGVLADIDRELSQIRAAAAVNESYWASATLTATPRGPMPGKRSASWCGGPMVSRRTAA